MSESSPCTHEFRPQRHKPQRILVIPAGGVGARMGQPQPKQYISIEGEPILYHTLSAFCGLVDKVIIAASEEFHPLCQEIAKRALPHIPITVVPAGTTRFHSVQNALCSLSSDIELSLPESSASERRTSKSRRTFPNPWAASDKQRETDLGEEKEEAIVAVHDAVRPMVKASVIEQCFAAAARYGAAAPSKPSIDSLRIYSHGSYIPLDRSSVVRISTPQCFSAGRLCSAYQQEYRESFTDDLSVYETLFNDPIHLLVDNEENIKITTPIDLMLLKHYLQKTTTTQQEKQEDIPSVHTEDNAHSPAMTSKEDSTATNTVCIKDSFRSL